MFNIGLIGYGAFGHSLIHWLSKDCNFTIYDWALKMDTVEAALIQPIVVFNIPAQNLEEFLSSHQAQLRPDCLYIDVCSVKILPVRLMKQYLPVNAKIIATHPLFGPQSAIDGLRGQKLMSHPVRVDSLTYRQFKDAAQAIGLRVLETTPEAHDKAMAYAQGLSHYLGRIMKQLDIPNSELSTRAYDDLCDMKRIQGNDSDALYTSILDCNPYTRQVLKDFDAARILVDTQFSIT